MAERFLVVEDNLKRPVLAKTLVDASGADVIDPITNAPLIVPRNYDVNRAIAFGKSIREHAIAASGYSNPLVTILANIGAVFPQGRSQDLQRTYNGVVGGGGDEFVRAFQSAASFHLGVVAGAAGLDLGTIKFGAGRYNRARGGRDTSGEHGNHPNNVRSMEAGFSALSSGRLSTSNPPAESGPGSTSNPPTQSGSGLFLVPAWIRKLQLQQGAAFADPALRAPPELLETRLAVESSSPENSRRTSPPPAFNDRWDNPFPTATFDRRWGAVSDPALQTAQAWLDRSQNPAAGNLNPTPSPNETPQIQGRRLQDIGVQDIGVVGPRDQDLPPVLPLPRAASAWLNLESTPFGGFRRPVLPNAPADVWKDAFVSPAMPGHFFPVRTMILADNGTAALDAPDGRGPIAQSATLDPVTLVPMKRLVDLGRPYWAARETTLPPALMSMTIASSATTNSTAMDSAADEWWARQGLNL